MYASATNSICRRLMAIDGELATPATQVPDHRGKTGVFVSQCGPNLVGCWRPPLRSHVPGPGVWSQGVIHEFGDGSLGAALADIYRAMASAINVSKNMTYFRMDE